LGRDFVVLERVIRGDGCVAEGAAFLASLDPRFKAAIAETGALPLRLRPDGFAQLLSAIVSQQVSTASAEAIWKRLQTAGLITEDAALSATEEDWRACGMSRQKIKYAGALAAERIDYNALRDMPSDDVVRALTKVSGIGSWTAEIYVMFSLGRADVFAPGDLALQEAAKVLFDLPDRPKEKAFREMAKAWSPWRSVAARALWAYYRVVKNREGIR